MESAKEVIMKYLDEKTGAKSKFYFNDFTKLFPDAKGREVKKVLTALVKEEKVEYWSSGSTTMYGKAGAGKQGAAEHED
ncbi:dissimilatory sulfite reductase D family protein [Maridesulfovibrio sp.]|uniref:dissimilatory sulfite reductase D family protein n=1 Tax=Maridesulfovibrio sp. TaxID=2795000 RepID=UPI002A18CB18|nr:dissimilatory sulfite reductase D family protein [Maridesulfovibrio sp.]